MNSINQLILLLVCFFSFSHGIMKVPLRAVTSFDEGIGKRIKNPNTYDIETYSEHTVLTMKNNWELVTQGNGNQVYRYRAWFQSDVPEFRLTLIGIGETYTMRMAPPGAPTQFLDELTSAPIQNQGDVRGYNFSATDNPAIQPGQYFLMIDRQASETPADWVNTDHERVIVTYLNSEFKLKCRRNFDTLVDGNFNAEIAVLGYNGDETALIHDVDVYRRRVKLNALDFSSWTNMGFVAGSTSVYEGTYVPTREGPYALTTNVAGTVVNSNGVRVPFERSCLWEENFVAKRAALTGTFKVELDQLDGEYIRFAFECATAPDNPYREYTVTADVFAESIDGNLDPVHIAGISHKGKARNNECSAYLHNSWVAHKEELLANPPIFSVRNVGISIGGRIHDTLDQAGLTKAFEEIFDIKEFRRFTEPTPEMKVGKSTHARKFAEELTEQWLSDRNKYYLNDEPMATKQRVVKTFKYHPELLPNVPVINSIVSPHEPDNPEDPLKPYNQLIIQGTNFGGDGNFDVFVEGQQVTYTYDPETTWVTVDMPPMEQEGISPHFEVVRHDNLISTGSFETNQISLARKRSMDPATLKRAVVTSPEPLQYDQTSADFAIVQGLYDGYLGTIESNQPKLKTANPRSSGTHSEREVWFTGTDLGPYEYCWEEATSSGGDDNTGTIPGWGGGPTIYAPRFEDFEYQEDEDMARTMSAKKRARDAHGTHNVRVMRGEERKAHPFNEARLGKRSGWRTVCSTAKVCILTSSGTFVNCKSIINLIDNNWGNGGSSDDHDDMIAFSIRMPVITTGSGMYKLYFVPANTDRQQSPYFDYEFISSYHSSIIPVILGHGWCGGNSGGFYPWIHGSTSKHTLHDAPRFAYKFYENGWENDLFADKISEWIAEDETLQSADECVMVGQSQGGLAGYQLLNDGEGCLINAYHAGKTMFQTTSSPFGGSPPAALGVVLGLFGYKKDGCSIPVSISTTGAEIYKAFWAREFRHGTINRRCASEKNWGCDAGASVIYGKDDGIVQDEDQKLCFEDGSVCADVRAVEWNYCHGDNPPFDHYPYTWSNVVNNQINNAWSSDRVTWGWS